MRLFMATCATGLLAALPLPARAQEIFGSGLHATRALVERQQYEQAWKQLQELRQSGLRSEQELTLALYEGLILASMGPHRQQEALAAFRSALLQEPQVRLPLKAPSRITREFEKVRAQVLAERRAASRALELSGAHPGGVRPGVSISSTHVLVASLTGGGLVASGGVLWALARREQSRIENADPELTSDDDLRRMASRGKTYQTLGFSRLGAGALGLGLSTTLYMRRKAQVPVTLGVGMSGTSVIAYGRWP